MIPYQGAKEKIARNILMCIPPAENFYDLFGGGGSVTEAACELQTPTLFEPHGRWRHIHYNEINKGVCELNKEVWAGTFDFEKARRTWISRERFFAEKDEPTAWGAYVRFCWSFGNDGDSYIYGKEIEMLRRYQWWLCLHCDGLFPKEFSPLERRQYLRKLLLKSFDEGLLPEFYSSRTSERPSGESLESLQSLQSLESLQRLERLEKLQSLQRLENLQSLQSLEKLQSLQSLSAVSITNADYRAVEIAPNSVVYCDIPYDTGEEHYASDGHFSHSEFYDWARSRPFPVYFSEYSAPDGFTVVWEKEIMCKMKRGAGAGGGIKRTEKLFWNGVKTSAKTKQEAA